MTAEQRGLQQSIYERGAPQTMEILNPEVLFRESRKPQVELAESFSFMPARRN
jgi:hypothetical protein